MILSTYCASVVIFCPYLESYLVKVKNQRHFHQWHSGKSLVPVELVQSELHQRNMLFPCQGINTMYMLKSKVSSQKA